MTDAVHNKRLVTVMAGYARGGTLSAITRRWIRALRQLSTQLVIVFDQDQVTGLEEFVEQDPGLFCLCRRHCAYDFGSYQLGLRIAR